MRELRRVLAQVQYFARVCEVLQKLSNTFIGKPKFWLLCWDTKRDEYWLFAPQLLPFNSFFLRLSVVKKLQFEWISGLLLIVRARLKGNMVTLFSNQITLLSMLQFTWLIRRANLYILIFFNNTKNFNVHTCSFSNSHCELSS